MNLKSTGIILVFLSFIFSAKAQNRFGNEWIKFDQKYLKITVSEDGIYRVLMKDLVNAGWNLSDINPQKLQLFFYGKEVSIFSSTTNSTATLDDYIEFFGEKNTGVLDSLLYRPTTARANPYYSMFTDDSNYFLTQGSSNGLRMTVFQTSNTTQSPETYHIEHQVQVNTEDYSFNNIQGPVPFVMQSYYEVGEGRTGPLLNADTTSNHYFNFKDRIIIPNEKPKVSIRVNGRSRTSHRLDYQFLNESQKSTFDLDSYGVRDITKTLDESMIVNEKTKISFNSSQKVDLDWYSVSYLVVNYPQKTTLNGQDKYFYLHKNVLQKSILDLSSTTPNTICYDLSNKQKIVKILPINTRFEINGTDVPKTIYTSIALKTNFNISLINFIDYTSFKSDYLIVTDTSLKSSSMQYAEYRSSQNGGSFQPLVVYCTDLYNQFTNGDKTVLAIRRFTDLMLTQKTSTSNLLLIGKPRTFPYDLRTGSADNLVPSFGYPGSDGLITAGLFGMAIDVPAIPTGRIVATKNAEVINYLNKVIEFETESADNAWKKEVLHLNGGHDESEISYLAGILRSHSNVVENGTYHGVLTAKSKSSNLSVENVDISPEINKGVAFLGYAGHGTSQTLDFNFGFCSDVKNGFANKGKYPLMFFDGCGVGNCFNSYYALSTDWIVTPNKGAIVVLANSYWSFGYSTEAFLNNFYPYLFSDPSTYNLSIGKIHQKSIEAMAKSQIDDYIRSEMTQLILQGDPALKIFPMQKPDYAVKSGNAIFVRGLNEIQNISKNDSLTITLIAANYGLNDSKAKVNVNISLMNNNALVKKYTYTTQIMSVADTLDFIVAKPNVFTDILININEDKAVDEYTFLNNNATLHIADKTAFDNSLAYPYGIYIDRMPPEMLVTFDNRILKNGDYVSKNPTINVTITDNNAIVPNNIQLYLAKCATCDLALIDSAQYLVKINSAQNLEIVFKPTNLASSDYKLAVDGQDVNGNKVNSKYIINFSVSDNEEKYDVLLYPTPSLQFVSLKYTIIAPKAPFTSVLKIYNVLGQNILNLNAVPYVGENVFQINRDNFSAGTYYLKLELDGKTEVIKKAIFE